MRRLFSSCAAAALLALGAAGVLMADEPGDRFVTNSVWQGTMEQSDPKSTFPVILFIKERKEDAFEGTTYYPTLGNGLLRVTGQIDKKGSVTFTEDKVLHAERMADGNLCVANSKYSARLDKTTLKGTGELREYIDPNTKQTVRPKEAIVLTFSIKLAE